MDAVCDRFDHEGRPQPPFVPTVTENLGDLGWHEKEFELRRSFAYTVVAGPLRAGDPYAADIRRDVPLGGGGSVDRTTG